jgi:hypothetical protein
MSKASKALKIEKKAANKEAKAETKAANKAAKVETKAANKEAKAGKTADNKAAKVEAKQLKIATPGVTTTASMESMPVGSLAENQASSAPRANISEADRIANRLLKQKANSMSKKAAVGRNKFVIKKAGY